MSNANIPDDARDRESLKSLLLELAAVAASAITPYFRQQISVENKIAQAGQYDPVTIADREAETAIRETITAAYPHDAIFGEEFETKQGESRYSWVIDPIDGTKAFVCGLPTWASLIAICYDGIPILGLMAQPVVGDVFVGGMGYAELLKAREQTRLSTRSGLSLAACNLFATAPDMFSPQEKIAFDALSDSVQMTRFGVDSYAYCLLAAGHIDLVVESGLGFYDIAALIPLIEAAGGVVTDWEGRAVRQGGRVIAAANPAIHQEALRILQIKTFDAST